MKTIRTSFLNFPFSIPIIVVALLLIGFFEDRILSFLGLDPKVFDSSLFILVYLIFSTPMYFYQWIYLPNRYKSYLYRLRPEQYYEKNKDAKKHLIRAYRVLGFILILCCIGIGFLGHKELFPIFMVFLLLFVIISFSFGVVGLSRIEKQKDQVYQIWVTPDRTAIQLLEGKVLEFENSEIIDVKKNEGQLNMIYLDEETHKTIKFSVENYTLGELSDLLKMYN